MALTWFQLRPLLLITAQPDLCYTSWSEINLRCEISTSLISAAGEGEEGGGEVEGKGVGAGGVETGRGREEEEGGRRKWMGGERGRRKEGGTKGGKMDA